MLRPIKEKKEKKKKKITSSVYYNQIVYILSYVLNDWYYDTSILSFNYVNLLYIFNESRLQIW